MKIRITGIRWVSAACGLALLLTASCAVGPEYKEPEPKVPDAWENAAAADVEGDAPVLENWWSLFNDPLLDELIRRSRLANPDMKAAISRIREATAYYQIASGDQWPQLEGTGSFSRNEVSENGPAADALAAGADNPSNNYQAGLGATWEVDVFGRVQRSMEATAAQVEASIEDYRDVMVSLYAEVAAAYVQVRTLQARLDFARNNVVSQRDTLEIVIAREDAGLVPLLDVAQARSNLANTEASIPQLESFLERARNRLAILLGQAPGSLDEVLAPHQPIPSPSTKLALALPMELLRRRPDVRRSERNVAAQTARVGVATTELYPSFSLAGTLTLESTHSNDFAQNDSFGWSLVPGMRWNLFTGGKIRGKIKVEEARTDQALAAYEKTVLNALAEVENSLVALRQEEARRDLLQVASDASQQSVELVQTQYMEGLTDFQNYLDSQRALFNQQDQLAVSMGQVVTNLIVLNRAMGGGWSLEQPIPGMNDEEYESVTAHAGGDDPSVDEE